MRVNWFVTRTLLFGFLAAMSTAAWAVPYASSVRDLDGGGAGLTWEFVLNEAADGVTVLRDGGNPQNLGALAAGRYTFDMTTYSTFEIKVQDEAATGWTSITDPSNLFDDFTLPTGLAINNNPSNLAYFGAVYVGNAQAVNTKSGRAMGDGVYALTADMKGVNAATFAAVADPNDTTQAKAPGFSTTTSTASPWRMTMDDSGNLIIGDWSDPAGGIKYALRDLATGGLVLGGTDASGNPVADGAGTGDPVVYAQEMDEFGRIPLHGSIAAKPYVTGSVGVDLTVWAMDEDLDVDLAVPGNDGNSIWKWNVGSATNYDALAPELVIEAGAIEPTSDGRSNFLNLNIGVSANLHYDPGFDKWYLVEPRDGSSAGADQGAVAIITADGVDGTSPVLEWSSLQFSIDNNLDGNPALGEAGCSGQASCLIQDMFRRTRDVTISPDGEYMILHRNTATPAVNGVGSGAVLLVPLDENGLPDITIEGGVITNVIDITTLGNNGAHNSGAQVEFDAAGNLYVANSAINTTSADPLLTGQLVQVFSPGGNWIATTKSDGTFTLEPFVPPAGVLGDFNGDDKVDAADYVVWRKNDAANGALPNDDGLATQAERYTLWMNHFGEMAMAGGGSDANGAVPEPGTCVLAAVGMLMLAACRRRQV